MSGKVGYCAGDGAGGGDGDDKNVGCIVL